MDQASPSHSRTSSVHSYDPSIASHAASTRYMLADMTTPLEPPTAPFAASRPNSFRSFSPKTDTPLMSNSDKHLSTSLSINYLPSKFSNTITKRGRGKKGDDNFLMPKQGGGREAFRSNEARMPGDNDDDYDGVSNGIFGSGKAKKGRLRWNRFKWVLFVSNLVLTLYSLAGLIACLLIWFDVWTHADIVRVGNHIELIISTIAASLGLLTSLIGWSGLLLNNRSFLAVYCFLLWICFAMLVTPGYITYKKRTFNLEGKLNSEWSRTLGISGRLRVQNQLGCCGYFNPFIEATASQTCYSRSLLPGCKGPYLKFEKNVLKRWYTVIFAIVPFHMVVMVLGLLCSNHVTYRFGKGMMPKAYRLNMNSMAVIMDNYANQLAEQYGNDVASEIVARSRSNLNLDSMPSVHYSNGPAASNSGTRYESLKG